MNLFSRTRLFWLIQAVGILAIQAGVFSFELSVGSAWAGILLVFLNMEILLWIVRTLFSTFYLIFLKYTLFGVLIYFLKDYIDFVSFLVGLSSMIFYIIGLLIGVKRK